MTVTTTDRTVTPAALEDTGAGTSTAASKQLVEEELLVEDVSIDGMCGVY